VRVTLPLPQGVEKSPVAPLSLPLGTTFERTRRAIGTRPLALGEGAARWATSHSALATTSRCLPARSASGRAAVFSRAFTTDAPAELVTVG